MGNTMRNTMGRRARLTTGAALLLAPLLWDGVAAAEVRSPKAAPAPVQRPASGKTASWDLGKLAVVVPAEVREMPEGKLSEGYTLQGKAKAFGEAPIQAGGFLMTISSFFPAKDLPRQPRGMYYVSGKWRLVKEGVQVSAENGRGPGIIQGTVVAALPQDPTAGAGGWTMRLRLTPSQTSGPWKRGEGTLIVSAQQEAQLSLTLE